MGIDTSLATIPNDLVDNVQTIFRDRSATEFLNDPIRRGSVSDPVGDLFTTIRGLCLVDIHLRRTRCGEIFGGGPAMAVFSLTMGDVKDSCHLIERVVFPSLSFFFFLFFSLVLFLSSVFLPFWTRG